MADPALSEIERAAHGALDLLSKPQRDVLCVLAGAPALRKIRARPTHATWRALATLGLITTDVGGQVPTPVGLAVVALLHPEASMPTNPTIAAPATTVVPQLPDTIRPIGSYQISLQHGPNGYQASAYGGFPPHVVARTVWLPDPGATLAAIAAAVTPNFTRTAARDLAPPRDDD